MIPALRDHLATGHTTLCRCWALVRRDGAGFGFTDHDTVLSFDGIEFRPDSGLSASAMVQGTGLAVDNTEVLGALSDAAIREDDLAAGRFDGAEVRLWLVNWADPAQRDLRFRGTLGQIRRGQGAFHAELRGLTEQLNQPRGRVYHRDCAAVLGDARCRFALDTPGFAAEVAIATVEDDRHLVLPGLGDYADRWFDGGRLRVLTGAGAGLEGVVKTARLGADGSHAVDLWEPVRATLAPGDTVRIEAGCDKRAKTCRFKFANFVNFQGFPHIPGDDWLVAGPRAAAE